MPKYFGKADKRTTHRISQSPSVRNIPSTSYRKPNPNKPAPLYNSRCANCGRK